MTQNFALFESWIAGCKDDFAVCKGLAKLVVVDIALNRDQDNPQLIFESMNSTGRELSQADLIRNFILMGLEPVLQTRLYEQFWRPMEVDFGQEAYGTHFDGFMRHYLTVKTGEIPERARGVRGVQGARSFARCGPGWCGSSGQRHPRLRPLFLRDGARRRSRRGPQARLPRPARAEGGCGLSLPAGAVPRLRGGGAVRGTSSRQCGWSRPMCSGAPSAPSRPTR